MSKKEYPCIGGATKREAWIKNPKNSPQCVVVGCESSATHRVDVQVDWFRGNDEVGKACDAHRKDAIAVLRGIDAEQAKKDAEISAQADAMIAARAGGVNDN